MSSETYYFIATVLAVIGALSGVVIYFLKRHDSTEKRITYLVGERNVAIENLRARADAGFAQSSQRYAELSERITREKLENLREMQPYVTRSEMDKRFERIENFQGVLNNKMDAILQRIAGVKHWPPEQGGHEH